jgi:hypothetical protein
MSDWYVMLTPMLVLPIVLLFAFVGCHDYTIFKPVDVDLLFAYDPSKVEISQLDFSINYNFNKMYTNVQSLQRPNMLITDNSHGFDVTNGNASFTYFRGFIDATRGRASLLIYAAPPGHWVMQCTAFSPSANDPTNPKAIPWPAVTGQFQVADIYFAESPDFTPGYSFGFVLTQDPQDPSKFVVMPGDVPQDVQGGW